MFVRLLFNIKNDLQATPSLFKQTPQKTNARSVVLHDLMLPLLGTRGKIFQHTLVIRIAAKRQVCIHEKSSNYCVYLGERVDGRLSQRLEGDTETTI
jgi:hypothetical protein